MIAFILGTRPEIIKISPLIHACEEKKIDYFTLHTGQHYSYTMDRVFFEQLELSESKYHLNVGSGSHGEQTGKMLIGIEKVLADEQPDVVLVQGDTNTVLAGALAARKLNIRVGHVEAGLRSFDRGMPEEVNRIVADHCSDYLFAPTEHSRNLLLAEGIPSSKISVTGNTIVDAVNQNLKIAGKKMDILSDLGLKEGEYILTTVHRQENVDSCERFKDILDGLEAVGRDYGLPVVYPIHPRSEKMLKQFKLDLGNIRLIEPLDYLGFLQLLTHTRLILTDSGGIQEEACILRVPCVTLRENTERPETIKVGANMLAGTSADRIVNGVKMMLERERVWENPFGDGMASMRILDAIQRDIEMN